jgi:hypothetical protein
MLEQELQAYALEQRQDVGDLDYECECEMCTRDDVEVEGSPCYHRYDDDNNGQRDGGGDGGSEMHQ